MTPEATKFLEDVADAFQAKGVTNLKVQPFQRKRGGLYDELLENEYVEFYGTDKFVLAPKGWAWVTAYQTGR
jgi:hypothetical protein